MCIRDSLKIVRVAPCRHHRLATWDIAMVIGTPNIDQEIVTALLLIVVIGNIAHEISKLTVLFDEHAVFLIAEFARFEIRCAILLIDVAALLHGIEGMLDLRLAIFIRNEERMLGEIGIELRAEKLERVAQDVYKRQRSRSSDFRYARFARKRWSWRTSAVKDMIPGAVSSTWSPANRIPFSRSIKQRCDAV